MIKGLKNFLFEPRIGILPFLILHNMLNLHVEKRTWVSLIVYVFTWCAACALAGWLYRVEER